MIRQFYLENEYGDLYYLNYKNRTLISQVSGLGFSLDLKYLEYSNLYSKSEYDMPLSEIQETLIFLDGYQGYKKFMDYLAKSQKSLKLHYINDAFSAYCYVDISSITKSELVANTIHSQITLKKLSLWLKEKTIEIIANGSQVKKSYPYLYPYAYSSSYNGRINIKNEGLDKAPLVIEISGDVINPEVNIIKNGLVISKLKLYIEKSNATVKVNSVPNKQEMTLEDTNQITNIYQEQDFNEDNFLYLDHGEYELEFKPGTATKSRCKIILLEGHLGI